LIFLACRLRKKAENNENVTRWSNVMSVLILMQVAFGAITLLTLAPILMQLGHLFLADAVWISFVLLTASFLAEQKELA
jgi:heme a synthase